MNGKKFLKIGNKTDIPFPSWATRRGDGWVYAGWDSAKDDDFSSFEHRREHALQSDHGEERGVDIYSEGATYWWREKPA